MTGVQDVAEATRARLATREGDMAWMRRRRAGLCDSANWALSAAEAAGRVISGEELAAVVTAITGRNA